MNRRSLTLSALALLLYLPPGATAAEEYIFTAPPRETGKNEANAYQPVADYLSAVTGKRFVYRYSDNWLTYQNEMRRGVYDLVFDGPHFISWRMDKLQHEPLVKLPGKLGFVVVTKKDNNKINSLKDLTGRTVCGLGPPNLATFILYSRFDNPMRQPLIIEVKSFKAAYEGVVAGKCLGAVMRDSAYNNLEQGQGRHEGRVPERGRGQSGVFREPAAVGPGQDPNHRDTAFTDGQVETRRLLRAL
jgi:hypothetical protein